ncbi:MAG: hypothetical protein JNL83_22555 [Myxococcales bacterium]|nr:hypothetical protein [Myxococcales bacterium]
MSGDKKLAKDVARQLDRRQLRRKLLIWGLVIAAIVAAILFVTCGRGWGLGGAGKGEGSGSSVPADAGPKRCAIRVTATGITLDGVASTRDAIVSACAGATADVVVTGDARQGDWDDLKAALERANIPVFLKQR